MRGALRRSLVAWQWPLVQVCNYSPPARTSVVLFSFARRAGVAQLVEQLIRNQQVIGSSPIAGSNSFSRAHSRFFGLADLWACQCPADPAPRQGRGTSTPR